MNPRTRKSLALLAVCLLAGVCASAQSGGGRAHKPKPTPAPVVTPVPSVVPTPALDEETTEALPPTDKGTAVLAEGATSETEILAMEGAQFSSKERVAVFTGSVRVTDPRFQLACDELTVYLKKTSAKTPAAATTPAPLGAPTPTSAPSPAATGADDQSAMGGGIDHAVAKGHVIIVQERAATDGGEPKRSIGRGERADFDNNTGDMVLHGLPSVEQNGNTHVATSPSTVMTLRRDNSLVTKGPSRTLITQKKGDETTPGGTASGAGAHPRS